MRRQQSVRSAGWGAAFLACSVVGLCDHAGAFEDGSTVEIVSLRYRKGAPPDSRAAARLAWELRKRSSVEPKLESGVVRLDEPALFRSPLVYWGGGEAFPPLSDAEIEGLRRFIYRGGFVVVDDQSAGGDGFDRSIRRELVRAFPAHPLETIPETHTIYRSFYLIRRPVGRVEGPSFVEGVVVGGRVTLVYTRHDLGGALERDPLGNWANAVVPGGEAQRELAIRFGVNLAMYALCLDYKDDQVHAPFIMRRRGRGP